jgi:hypothetical protein
VITAREVPLEAEVASAHPIIFLYDDACDGLIVPEHVRDELVAFNDRCVSVGTQYSAHDGPTRVRMARRISRPALIEVFAGTLSTPSGRLSLCTSEAEGLLVVDVGTDRADIRVYVDDARWPSQVDVEVTAPVLFKVNQNT